LRIAAVDRAIDILSSFHVGESSLSLTELAARTGLYKSTTLRFLHTLERRGFISRLTDGTYRLGSALLQLGTIYQKSFRLEDILVPHLSALADVTGESASFFVSYGVTKSCLFRSEPKQAIRHHVEIGEVLPLDAGATGPVFSAFAAGAGAASAEQWRALPITNIGASAPDLSVMAGPVFGAGGKLIGAISISGPTSRFDHQLRQIVARELIKVLKVLSIELGAEANVFSYPNAEKIG
jgi:DNA-binding IclR family transcriptional regulator